MNFLAAYASDDDDNADNEPNAKRSTLNDANNTNDNDNSNNSNNSNDNDSNAVRNPLLAGLPAPRHAGVKRGAGDAGDESLTKRAATTTSSGVGGLIGSRLRDEPKAVAKPSGPITFQSIDADAVAERGRELEQKRLADEQIARECAPRSTALVADGDAAAPKRSMFAALLPAPKHATSVPAKHAQHAAGIELGDNNSNKSVNASDSNVHRIDNNDAAPLLAAPTSVDDAIATTSTTNTYTEVRSLLFFFPSFTP